MPRPAPRRSRLRLLRPLRRGGALTVEFALTLPVVFLLFWAAVEFSRVNVLRHSLQNACYEGARAAVVPGATTTDATTSAQRILDIVGTRNAAITVTPNPIKLDSPQVTVSITVPLNGNGFIAPLFFRNRSLVGSATLTREVAR